MALPLEAKLSIYLITSIRILSFDQPKMHCERYEINHRNPLHSRNGALLISATVCY